MYVYNLLYVILCIYITILYYMLWATQPNVVS